MIVIPVGYDNNYGFTVRLLHIGLKTSNGLMWVKVQRRKKVNYARFGFNVVDENVFNWATRLKWESEGGHNQEGDERNLTWNSIDSPR